MPNTLDPTLTPTIPGLSPNLETHETQLRKLSEALTQAQAEEKIAMNALEALTKRIRIPFVEDLHAPVGKSMEDNFRDYEQLALKNRALTGKWPLGDKFHAMIVGYRNEWRAMADQRQPDHSWTVGPVSEKCNARAEREKQLRSYVDKVAGARRVELNARQEEIRQEVADYLLVIWEGDRESAYGLSRFNPAALDCVSRYDVILFSALMKPLRCAEILLQELQTPLPVSPVPKVS